MKLPRDLVIDDDKLTQYLLLPRRSDDKSKFLAQAGFSLKNHESLRQEILRLVGEADAIEDGVNEYGTFYRVSGELIGPNTRRLRVVTVWLRSNLDGVFRFVTLKPERN